MTQKNKNKYPDYMKSSVTHQFLAKNPLYRNIFKVCPICAKYSLKPVGLNQIKDISQIKDVNERHCSLCNFVHVTNLSVETSAANTNTIPFNKAGKRILE